MIGMLIRIVAFLAVGVALAIIHARSIADGERIFRETGERARPAVLFAIRLVLLCMIFAVIGKMGPIPLGSAVLGFFGGRVIVHRGLTSRRPDPQ